LSSQLVKNDDDDIRFVPDQHD